MTPTRRRLAYLWEFTGHFWTRFKDMLPGRLISIYMLWWLTFGDGLEEDFVTRLLGLAFCTAYAFLNPLLHAVTETRAKW